MEYLKFYDLAAEPFRNELDAQFYFESKVHARSRIRIARAVVQRKGLAVLFGPAGCGKTTLAHNIETSLHGPELVVRRISIPRSDCSGGWLLGHIASEFGVPKPSGDPFEALEQVRQRFVQIHEEHRHPVLLLDEAQMLHEPMRMEELRALLNLERGDGRRVLSVVLFGLPELLRILESDPSLAQRVEVRQRLDVLDREDVSAYLAHRLGCVGGSMHLFTSGAVEALAAISRGVPRVLNSLADNALFEAALAECELVDPSIVLAACEAMGLEPPEPSEIEMAVATVHGTDSMRAGAGFGDAELVSVADAAQSQEPVAAPSGVTEQIERELFAETPRARAHIGDVELDPDASAQMLEPAPRLELDPEPMLWSDVSQGAGPEMTADPALSAAPRSEPTLDLAAEPEVPLELSRELTDSSSTRLASSRAASSAATCVRSESNRLRIRGSTAANSCNPPGRWSRTSTRCKPVWLMRLLSTGPTRLPTSAEKAACSRAGLWRPRANRPRSPPLDLLASSWENSRARSAKSSPASIRLRRSPRVCRAAATSSSLDPRRKM